VIKGKRLRHEINEKEDVTSYWIALRKREDVCNGIF